MRLIMILLAALSFQATAQVYKWVDENGVTHFGNQPPPGEKEEVEIRPSSSGSSAAAAESDIIRQARELERKRQIEAAERRYESASAARNESPDYICKGAENRLESAKERWEAKRRQGYTVSDEQYYEQLIRDRQRHRDNVCR